MRCCTGKALNSTYLLKPGRYPDLSTDVCLKRLGGPASRQHHDPACHPELLPEQGMGHPGLLTWPAVCVAFLQFKILEGSPVVYNISFEITLLFSK
ncbi:hypothetical protein AVEN_180086-1 [Araneus ventricosus]|uniref:Uncharacterized protein n=1 Tax=Araneus ventricosus TaxID=182803 RepID=A0A4Y2N719_ARAVE|nr:hypothetical protein AVEN_180086-1 [Araneus ventricosus]